MRWLGSLAALFGLMLVLFTGFMATARRESQRPYWIVYAPAGVYRVGVTGAGFKELWPDLYIPFNRPALSPDQGSLAFVGSSILCPQIYQLDIRTDAVLALTDERGDCRTEVVPHAFRELQWSPDSDWVYAVYTPSYSTTDARAPALRSDIYRVHVPSGEPQYLTRNGFSESPALSPDGRWLAYVENQVGDPSRATLMRMGSDGSAPVTLSAAPGVYAAPSWSPDANWVYFQFQVGGNWEIYRVQPDGSGRQRITDSPGYDGAMTWAPDGAWMAFISERDGDRELFRMRPDGSQAQQLTRNGSEEGRPVWAPNGEWIAYVSYRPGGRGIYRIRPDGSDAARVATDHSRDWHPAWMPMNQRSWHVAALGLLVGVPAAYLALGAARFPLDWRRARATVSAWGSESDPRPRQEAAPASPEEIQVKVIRPVAQPATSGHPPAPGPVRIPVVMHEAVEAPSEPEAEPEPPGLSHAERQALVGEIETSDDVDVVAGYADHEDPLVRLYAVQRLGNLGDASAAEPLHAALDDDQDVVQRAARFALDKLNQPAPDTD